MKVEMLMESEDLVNEIFGSFGGSPKTTSAERFQALQQQFVANAGGLVSRGLITMKDLVDILLKLEAASQEQDGAGGNDEALKTFLRRGDSSNTQQQ
jgi:hypothetical protein